LYSASLLRHRDDSDVIATSKCALRCHGNGDSGQYMGD